MIPGILTSNNHVEECLIKFLGKVKSDQNVQINKNKVKEHISTYHSMKH